MKQELVFGEVQIFGFLRGEHYAVGAFFQSYFKLRLLSGMQTLGIDGAHQGNDIGRLCGEFVRQFFIVRD